MAKQHEMLDVGPSVGDVDLTLMAAAEWERRRHGGLDWAASSQGPATIVDARQQTLLKGVGYVSVA
jgi:hypothetical protein